jgi:tetratricopeptide (TPR) repeat protein
MREPIRPPTETQGGTIDQALANGLALLATNPETALIQALTILKRGGTDPRAFRLAAAAHRKLGEVDQAHRAELAAIHHSGRVPALAAAAKALEDGQPGEASRIAAEHLRSSPDDLAALTLSAESAIALKLADKAEPLLRMVLERAPHFAPALKLLISALMVQDKLVESRSLIQKLVAQQPKDEDSLRLLARVEADLGNQAAAVRVYELLLKLRDDAAELWLLYGDALRFLGRKIDSQLAYRRALSIDPNFGQAWWSLADLDPTAVDSNDVAEMEKVLFNCVEMPVHAANLRFALGMVLDAKGRHTEAFTHFEAGNALTRAAQPYNPDDLSAQIDRYMETLRKGQIPAMASAPPDKTTPIFIVGMPRSGSTLVERILGRHSSIEALGELPLIPHIIESLKREDATMPLEQRVAAFPPIRYVQLAQRYRDRAGERRHTERPFFTDKMHMNWRHLAVILRMFPEARIINVRRAALDCCWSNYKLLFARGHPAAASLGDIGRMYVDYDRFLEHMEAIAPGRILRLNYEALVENIESETRRMLDYVGVPFEVDCLNFHQSSQPVSTASSEQVRQPLNRDGIGTWQPYSKWLGPLRSALGELADK